MEMVLLPPEIILYNCSFIGAVIVVYLVLTGIKFDLLLNVFVSKYLVYRRKETKNLMICLIKK